MADTQEEQNEEIATQDRNTELRRSLSDAYAALQSDQAQQSFAAFTFEEALDAQIERIEGKGTQLRPNLLDRVARIEARVVQAVDQAKALDPEVFTKPDAATDVNTANDPE